MHKYNFIEHFTQGIGVQLAASSIDQIFVGAANAWKETAIEEWEFKGTEYKQMELESLSKNFLLIEFIENINSLFNKQQWLFERVIKVEIQKSGSLYKLNSILYGGKVDFSTFPVKDEIIEIFSEEMEIFEENNVFSTVLIFETE